MKIFDPLAPLSVRVAAILVFGAFLGFGVLEAALEPSLAQSAFAFAAILLVGSFLAAGIAHLSARFVEIFLFLLFLPHVVLVIAGIVGRDFTPFRIEGQPVASITIYLASVVAALLLLTNASRRALERKARDTVPTERSEPIRS